MIRILLFTILMVMTIALKANNISIQNIVLSGQNTTDNYTLVQFDISWENSWRTSTESNNWDAAWVFVKYRLTDGEWHHAGLNNSGHSAPEGSIIDIGLLSPGSAFDATTNPVMGTFIYREDDGTGTFSLNGVKLRWNYGSNNVNDNAVVDIQVYAIEMVYVPEGSFYVGSGGTENGAFYKYPTITNPYQISSEGEITVGTGTDNLNYFGSIAGDQAGPIPGTFPKGYAPFYCMKYEIGQQAFVDFLNSLTYTQQATRASEYILPNSTIGTYCYATYRHRIKISSSGTDPNIPATYSSDNPYVACNYLSWADLIAYLDWCGLRPMTELEFEKACRGPIVPVADEYAWGTAVKAIGQYTYKNVGQTNEVIDLYYSTTSGNAAAPGLVQNSYGPLRVGIFAGTSDNTGRVTSGATYYGIMEMSGNLIEQVIMVSQPSGRAFTGAHGNGILDSMGETETYIMGSRYRGGDWVTNNLYLRVSERDILWNTYPTHGYNYGGRGVRSAP